MLDWLAIGEDEGGQEATALLAEAGVDLSALATCIRRPAQIDSREENSIAVLHFGRTTYQDNRIKLSLVPAVFRRMPVNKVDELFV